MRPDTITLEIFEKFTPENTAEIADQMATAIADLETIYTEKKTSDAAFNSRIKECDAKIGDLAKRYNKGGEAAQIGCDIRYDWPEIGKKSYVRIDNGETAGVHEMTWEEKQETIQFPITDQKTPNEITKDVVDAVAGKVMEELTQLCPYPRCILFLDHDGDHEFPEPPPVDDRPQPDQNA